MIGAGMRERAKSNEVAAYLDSFPISGSNTEIVLGTNFFFETLYIILSGSSYINNFVPFPRKIQDLCGGANSKIHI